jgi:two-component system, NarL family, nitrate/nitrite response regulator NarL
MTSQAPVRLLVVDDHTLFRRGITALLQADPRFEVVAEACDASEALRRAADAQPDVILLDNHLPGVKGVDALNGLKEVAPTTHILMLTVSEDAQDLAQALRGGACGYLLKTADSDALADAILRAQAGHATISPEMTPKLAAAFAPPPVPATGLPASAPAPASALETLSPREREILQCIAQGASNKEIARDLGIAEPTVKIHVQHILRKLNLNSRVQAAVYASTHDRS